MLAPSAHQCSTHSCSYGHDANGHTNDEPSDTEFVTVVLVICFCKTQEIIEVLCGNRKKKKKKERKKGAVNKGISSPLLTAVLFKHEYCALYSTWLSLRRTMFHFVDVACVNPRVLLCLDKDLFVLPDSVPGCDHWQRELVYDTRFDWFTPLVSRSN